MIVGLDARPALFGRTGFGRVVRETLRELAARPDVELRAYGAAWRRAEPDLAWPGARTPRLPARLQRALAPLGFGVETVLGELDVFHHTDLVFAPVRRTPEVLTIYDLVYLESRGWHAPGFAEAVEPRVRARARDARAVVVPCARVADAVLAARMVSAPRVHVAPLGCDHLPLAPLPDEAQRLARLADASGVALDEGRALVVVPGTREPRKNQLAVVEAFERLPVARDAALLLVGARGWGCAPLERRLQRRDGRVGSVGVVSDDDWSALLRRADVVAYPSFAEGFGLPAFEALRQGRAVLSSRDTPMADLGGDALELVDPGDATSIAAGLARLLGDAARRAELEHAGPPRVAGLTWAAHVDGLLRVYADALS